MLSFGGLPIVQNSVQRPPKFLRFAMFPEEKVKYEAEQSAKKDAKLAYRKEQSRLNKKGDNNKKKAA